MQILPISKLYSNKSGRDIYQADAQGLAALTAKSLAALIMDFGPFQAIGRNKYSEFVCPGAGRRIIDAIIDPDLIDWGLRTQIDLPPGTKL